MNTRNRKLLLLLTAPLLLITNTVTAQGYSTYLELRVYPVDETKQDRFLEFFEEHYLESQEVVGMRIWGQFKDLQAADRFVWLRGYRTMEERLAGLKQFYTSSVWMETGQTAVSMLTGRAQHVHFLEPVSQAEAFGSNWHRPLLVSEVTPETNPGILVAVVFRIEDELDELLATVRSVVVPDLQAAGGEPIGLFRSSKEPNNFPILPFIEDEEVVVLFSTFESTESYESALASIDPSLPYLETFLLEPGRRSRIRHRAKRNPRPGTP